jgi:hypothetical protein
MFLHQVKYQAQSGLPAYARQFRHFIHGVFNQF